MKTENLIQVLSRDELVPRKLFNHVAVGIALLGFTVSCIIFFYLFNVRYNLWTNGFSPTVMKLIFTVALVLSASAVLLKNVRPNDFSRRGINYLWLPLVIFLGYIFWDMMQFGTERLATRFYGSLHWVCFRTIIAMSLLPLFGMLWALQDTAPRHPGFTGMLVGVICGGAAASVYALYCSNDSPLFLSWYVLAIAVTSAIAALFAKRMLVW